MLAVALVFGQACTTSPAPDDGLEGCIARLKADPRDSAAGGQVWMRLAESDREVMASMRAHHGTTPSMMEHYYPSHRWIHPFLLGVLYRQQGREELAGRELGEALLASEEGLARGAASRGGFQADLARTIAVLSRDGLERTGR